MVPDASRDKIKIRPCPNPKFGDFQTNALMAIAKKAGKNPRELAEKVKADLDVADLCESVDIAGAGFLNFKISDGCIQSQLLGALNGEHLFSSPPEKPMKVVLDFSSPNVAKSMHVGHIRSTILGDCLARIFRFLGHEVISDNHIGDWGTQFGMLLYGWKNELNEEALTTNPIEELERIYKLINGRAESDQAFRETCKEELVKLQNGDAENIAIWERMIAISKTQFEEVYKRLDVKFDYTLGESAYNDALPQVVEELGSMGIARESEGATVVFFEDIKELKKSPAMIRKGDGGFNYSTTDLATIDYRLKNFDPDLIVYVTDGRQQLHFKQIFEIFKRWKGEGKTRLEHVWFGAILGDDGKPFKTRSGGTVKLVDLLDEAEQKALLVAREKNPDMDPDLLSEVARKIGLGAIKYADLLPNRNTDYRFSWEKMLALNGNTAVYLMYAYTRIKSIIRKADDYSPDQVTFTSLGDPAELALARKLLSFGFILESVLEEFRPNYLCNYLFELSSEVGSFWDKCPVLISEGQVRTDRLGLCQVTGMVLGKGLELLGIETVEKM